MALAILALMIILYQNFWPEKLALEETFTEEQIAELILHLEEQENLEKKIVQQKSARKVKEHKFPPAFNFDPNEASLNDWKLLGLSEKQANTILNYREKGGFFYQAEDLKKMYSISASFYQHIASSIKIKPRPKKETQINRNFHFKKSVKKQLNINLNDSDTSNWQKIRGIGPVLSKRIIKYRNRLGGFKNVRQVKEVYGISDSLFETMYPLIIIDSLKLKQMNVNTASAKDLMNHPYIGRLESNAIVKYRDMHGEFEKLEELKNIHILSDSLFNKIQAYLKI